MEKTKLDVIIFLKTQNTLKRRVLENLAEIYVPIIIGNEAIFKKIPVND